MEGESGEIGAGGVKLIFLVCLETLRGGQTDSLLLAVDKHSGENTEK